MSVMLFADARQRTISSCFGDPLEASNGGALSMSVILLGEVACMSVPNLVTSCKYQGSNVQGSILDPSFHSEVVPEFIERTSRYEN